MDPFTILAILSATSSAAGAVGSYAAAGEEEAFNSEISKINRSLALQSADDALIKGQQTETLKRVDSAKVIGKQRSGFSASGVVVGEGSAADVIDQSIALGELDALIIRDNALRESNAFELEAESARLQGDLAKSKGSSKKSASVIDFATSAINSFGKIF